MTAVSDCRGFPARFFGTLAASSVKSAPAVGRSGPVIGTLQGVVDLRDATFSAGSSNLALRDIPLFTVRRLLLAGGSLCRCWVAVWRRCLWR
jgi:hypothetical protein